MTIEGTKLRAVSQPARLIPTAMNGYDGPAGRPRSNVIMRRVVRRHSQGISPEAWRDAQRTSLVLSSALEPTRSQAFSGSCYRP